MFFYFCFLFESSRFIPVVLYREEKSDGNYQYTIGYIESFSGSSEFFSMESFTFSSGFQGKKKIK
jgi:hypothetical protein